MLLKSNICEVNIIKDIFTDQLLNIVDQSIYFERKFSTAVVLMNVIIKSETTPVFQMM